MFSVPSGDSHVRLTRRRDGRGDRKAPSCIDVSQLQEQEVFLNMVNLVLLAKVLGTSYAVAKQIDQILKKMPQREYKGARYRKVRKVRK